MRLKFPLFIFLALHFLVNPVLAVSDPRSVPNNVVGVNSLSPEAEMEEISSLVNSEGDWGYILMVIRKDERDPGRWQSVLNRAGDHHLIPIIRLATVIDKNGYWQKPGENDAKEWADFLSKLYFPTKNRYVQVYNEVNAGGEWGGTPDPEGYARELNKTIDALKKKSDDFFILSSPLDLSLPTSENSLEAAQFFQEMEKAVPGIFGRLDGWASHSYPNPDFSAHPSFSGRIGIDGFIWELGQIAPYTGGKDLPVFITETGWKREHGGYLTENDIAEYYKEAFLTAWNDERIAAITPFVFNYPEPLFDQFSFKKPKVGEEETYYSFFHTIQDMEKIKGEPKRENLIADPMIKTPGLVFKDMENKISLKFKNAGNYTWDSKNGLRVRLTSENIVIGETVWDKDKVYPGEIVEGYIKFKGEIQGTLPLELEIYDRDQVLSRTESVITIDTPLSLIVKVVKSLWPQKS